MNQQDIFFSGNVHMINLTFECIIKANWIQSLPKRTDAIYRGH